MFSWLFTWFFCPWINKISVANNTYQETTRIFAVKLSITKASKYRLKVGFWHIPTTTGSLASPAWYYHLWKPRTHGCQISQLSSFLISSTLGCFVIIIIVFLALPHQTKKSGCLEMRIKWWEIYLEGQSIFDAFGFNFQLHLACCKVMEDLNPLIIWPRNINMVILYKKKWWNID